MDPNVLWGVLVVAFFVLESWGIYSQNHGGRMKPLTYWVRKVFGLGQPRSYLGIGYWIAAGLVLWQVVHWLLEGTWL